MTTLIVGSTAMKVYVPERKINDLDCFTNDSKQKGDNYWDDSFQQFWGENVNRFATLNELYTIKVSHSYWELKNGSWDKHMSDVVALKRAGAHLIIPLHDLLYKVWEKDHGKKIVSLQQDKESFFTDAVTRIYDHDSVHYSVAYGEHPIYESVFKDGESIEMDMAKIRRLPFDTFVKLYREEVYATALERWVIPSNYKVSPRLAYARALKKTITSLTKGWSARMLVEHYEEFRDPDVDYVAHHKTKLDKLIKL